MLKVISLIVGQLGTNCYLVYDSVLKETAIVDPGDDAEFVINTVNKNDLKPVYVLATHGHYDHVLAVLELKLAYGIPFYMNRKDEFLLKRMKKTVKYYSGTITDPPPNIDKNIDDGDELALGKEKLEVMKAPGHTPGGLMFYERKAGVLICGDILFEGGVKGRTDHQYSNEKDLVDTIDTIKKLPEKTSVLSGHGNAFYLKDIN